MRPLRFVAAVALVALAAACGQDDGGRGDGRGGGDGGGTNPPAGDGVLVQVATGGGFVPTGSRLSEIPEVTITADGRVIVVGPTTEQFPGPALPNLQEGSVTDDQVREILDGAREAGLLDAEPPDYGEPGVTDMPTTVVTVNTDVARHRIAVYALSYNGLDDVDVGLTDEQTEARRRLDAFIRSLPTDGVSQRYEFDAMAVLARPYDDTNVAGSGIDPGESDWPAGDLTTATEPADDLGSDVRCLVVTGSDLVAVLGAAEQANAETRWRSGGTEWSLVFRPLLPGETACADLVPVRYPGA